MIYIKNFKFVMYDAGTNWIDRPCIFMLNTFMNDRPVIYRPPVDPSLLLIVVLQGVLQSNRVTVRHTTKMGTDCVTNLLQVRQPAYFSWGDTSTPGTYRTHQLFRVSSRVDFSFLFSPIISWLCQSVDYFFFLSVRRRSVSL